MLSDLIWRLFIQIDKNRFEDYSFHIEIIRCEDANLRVKLARNHEEDARVFKALCDEKRLRIIELLRGGEKCACELLEHVDIGQSSLSYHMKILVDSGMVTARQEGKWTHYSICREGCKSAIELLGILTCMEISDQAGGKSISMS